MTENAFSLFSSALSGDGLHGFFDGFFVAQKLHRLNRLKILVKLVDKWNARGEIESHDVIIAHVVQMLDNTSQGIAMGSNEDLLSFFNLPEKNNHAF